MATIPTIILSTDTIRGVLTLNKCPLYLVFNGKCEDETRELVEEVKSVVTYNDVVILNSTEKFTETYLEATQKQLVFVIHLSIWNNKNLSLNLSSESRTNYRHIVISDDILRRLMPPVCSLTGPVPEIEVSLHPIRKEFLKLQRFFLASSDENERASLGLRILVNNGVITEDPTQAGVVLIGKKVNYTKLHPRILNALLRQRTRGGVLVKSLDWIRKLSSSSPRDPLADDEAPVFACLAFYLIIQESKISAIQSIIELNGGSVSLAATSSCVVIVDKDLDVKNGYTCQSNIKWLRDVLTVEVVETIHESGNVVVTEDWIYDSVSPGNVHSETHSPGGGSSPHLKELNSIYSRPIPPYPSFLCQDNMMQYRSYLSLSESHPMYIRTRQALQMLSSKITKRVALANINITSGVVTEDELSENMYTYAGIIAKSEEVARADEATISERASPNPHHLHYFYKPVCLNKQASLEISKLVLANVLSTSQLERHIMLEILEKLGIRMKLETTLGRLEQDIRNLLDSSEVPELFMEPQQVENDDNKGEIDCMPVFRKLTRIDTDSDSSQSSTSGSSGDEEGVQEELENVELDKMDAGSSEDEDGISVSKGCPRFANNQQSSISATLRIARDNIRIMKKRLPIQKTTAEIIGSRGQLELHSDITDPGPRPVLYVGVLMSKDIVCRLALSHNYHILDFGYVLRLLNVASMYSEFDVVLPVFGDYQQYLVDYFPEQLTEGMEKDDASKIGSGIEEPGPIIEYEADPPKVNLADESRPIITELDNEEQFDGDGGAPQAVNSKSSDASTTIVLHQNPNVVADSAHSPTFHISSSPPFEAPFSAKASVFNGQLYVLDYSSKVQSAKRQKVDAEDTSTRTLTRVGEGVQKERDASGALAIYNPEHLQPQSFPFHPFEPPSATKILSRFDVLRKLTDMLITLFKKKYQVVPVNSSMDFLQQTRYEELGLGIGQTQLISLDTKRFANCRPMFFNYLPILNANNIGILMNGMATYASGSNHNLLLYLVFRTSQNNAISFSLTILDEVIQVIQNQLCLIPVLIDESTDIIDSRGSRARKLSYSVVCADVRDPNSIIELASIELVGTIMTEKAVFLGLTLSTTIFAQVMGKPFLPACLYPHQFLLQCKNKTDGCFCIDSRFPLNTIDDVYYWRSCTTAVINPAIKEVIPIHVKHSDRKGFLNINIPRCKHKDDNVLDTVFFGGTYKDYIQLHDQNLQDNSNPPRMVCSECARRNSEALYPGIVIYGSSSCFNQSTLLRCRWCKGEKVLSRIVIGEDQIIRRSLRIAEMESRRAKPDLEEYDFKLLFRGARRMRCKTEIRKKKMDFHSCVLEMLQKSIRLSPFETPLYMITFDIRRHQYCVYDKLFDCYYFICTHPGCFVTSSCLWSGKCKLHSHAYPPPRPF